MNAPMNAQPHANTDWRGLAYLHTVEPDPLYYCTRQQTNLLYDVS